MAPYRLLVLSIAVAITSGTTVAYGDDVGDQGPCPTVASCASDDSLSFWWERSAFDDIDMDTGWRPSGANVQVRLGVRILGRTQVGQDGSLDANWTSGELETRISGAQESGWLSIGYGIEVTAKFRFNVSVLGKKFEWEGDIPTPAVISKDLLLEADAEFTPFHLPGASREAVVVEDETGRVSAFAVGIGDSFVNIPGVSGKVSLDVRGTLRASYSDREVAIGSALANIEHTDEVAVVPTPDDGFGAGFDTSVGLRGNLEYTAGVTLYPNVELRILGFTIIDKDLFSFHQDIPSFDVGVEFDEQAARISLPDVNYAPAELVVASGEGATLTLENLGEARLRVDTVAWPEGLAPATFLPIIEPGHRLELDLFVDDTVVPIDQAAFITLRTNDPDQPVIEVPVTIRSHGPGQDSPSAGAAPAGGCRVSRGDESPPVGLLLAVAAALLFRRRRSGGAVV